MKNNLISRQIFLSLIGIGGSLFLLSCQGGGANSPTNTVVAAKASSTQATSGLVPLGASVNCTNGSNNCTTSFAIWSPDTSNVQLWVGGSNPQTYNLTNNEQYLSSYTLSTVYYITLAGNLNLTPYHFIINGVAVHDPYARMVDLNWQETNYSNNDIVMDLNQVTPPFSNYVNPANQTAAEVYELNVRDFTISGDSGVSANLRGTFSGLTQGGTTLNGVATGFDHIKTLGVNEVQIMPMFEYGSCSIADLQSATDPNSQTNWGYDPLNYNVPEWRYSQYNTYQYSNGASLPDPANLQYLQRIQEVQQMVDNFHQSGIGVIMDVVYNHTYDQTVLGNITSRYYTPNDLSGVGNSLDVSNPMVSQMVLDSLRYWISQYNVDGFRFDLMGVFPYANVKSWVTTLNQEFPNKHLLFYGEPWNGGQSDNAEAQKIRLGTISLTESTPGLAQAGVFNPGYRDALRGDGNSSANGGYIFNQPSSTYFSMQPIEQGTQGAIRYVSNEVMPIPALTNLWDPMFAYEPGEDVNYVSCHDNLNIWDKIKVWAYANPSRNSSLGYLKRIDMYAAGIIYTSQGISFIQSGDEFLRTKPTSNQSNTTFGVDDNDSGSSTYYSNNSYNLPDSVNQIIWDKLVANPDVNTYYQAMIALRAAHPALHMNTWNQINQNIQTTSPALGVLVSQIHGAAVGDSWKQIIVIYNSGPDYTVSLPAGTWHLIMSGGNPPTMSGTTVTENIVAAGTAVTILYQ